MKASQCDVLWRTWTYYDKFSLLYLNMDKALKNSTPGNWSRLYLNNWAVPNRRDKVWKDANSFFYWCFHCRRRSRCLRSLMHCIRFCNLFKIWRVLEATYFKLHEKEKSRNKNFGSHLRIEVGHFRIRHLHISHNTPCLRSPPTPHPKILHILCFSFLLGITAVSKEIDDNVYAQFWGANEVHFGIR